MIQTIKLAGIDAFGHHGVFDFEKQNGQQFLIDAEIEFDASEAIASDDVANTLNYAQLAELIKQNVESDPVDLLETLVSRVTRMLIALDPKIISVFIRITKPSAPMDSSLGKVSISARLTK